MKGIVLSGGSGTRLYPITKSFTKQLLPIYDKPMIYYPLSVLMLSGIKDILIITTPDDIHLYKKLLGDGSQLGVKFSYLVQEKPKGIAQAFVVGESFIGSDNVCLVLGDNIFYGNGLGTLAREAVKNADNGRATILGYYVNDPERYGIVEFDENGKVLSVEEKPQNPKSNYCITGLYFYPAGVSRLAAEVKPSARGELEITSLNELYLKQDRLDVRLMSRGFAWFDTGTMDSLMEASEFVRMIENRQSTMIAALEEIAFYKGWITREQLYDSAVRYGKSFYGKHLHNVADGKIIY